MEIARLLREEHEFHGHMHLKTMPEASPELIAAAGRAGARRRVGEAAKLAWQRTVAVFEWECAGVRWGHSITTDRDAEFVRGVPQVEPITAAHSGVPRGCFRRLGAIQPLST